MNTHASRTMSGLIAARLWLTVYELPPYAPELNPVEGVWSDTQRLIRETAGHLREQIAQLTEQLATAEKTLERLEITRETVLELAGKAGLPLPEPLPPGYRDILAAFEKADGALRAKDVCQALGTRTEPRHVEGIRAKLKRLVSRDILTEP
ncbi:transposase [Streptomyces sp. NPDC014864]|uniref:transposase n=1 Tax=Streptomyces sp. NPDC014864 TaxID=3364924 RepID=UPI0036FC6E95